jgi:hypothetical protein
MILKAVCEACGKEGRITATDLTPRDWWTVYDHDVGFEKETGYRRTECRFCSPACVLAWATRATATAAEEAAVAAKKRDAARERERARLATELQKHAEPPKE